MSYKFRIRDNLDMREGQTNSTPENKYYFTRTKSIRFSPNLARPNNILRARRVYKGSTIGVR